MFDPTTLLIVAALLTVIGVSGVTFTFVRALKEDASRRIEETPAPSPAVACMNAGLCPDCGEEKLLAGPRGGMSTNILCNGCLTEFNVHHSFSGVLAVDRTGKATESRAAVFGIGRDEYRQIERELYSGER